MFIGIKEPFCQKFRRVGGAKCSLCQSSFTIRTIDCMNNLFKTLSMAGYKRHPARCGLCQNTPEPLKSRRQHKEVERMVECRQRLVRTLGEKVNLLLQSILGKETSALGP